MKHESLSCQFGAIIMHFKMQLCSSISKSHGADIYYLRSLTASETVDSTFDFSSLSFMENGSFSDFMDCLERNLAGRLFGDSSSSCRGIRPILVWELASTANP
jgi:hypothetical protein